VVGLAAGLAVGVATRVAVGAGVLVEELPECGTSGGVEVGVDVEVGVLSSASAQLAGVVIVLPSNVTAPICDKARPFKVAPVARVIEPSARIFPVSWVPTPRTAAAASLGKRHHTSQGLPPTTLPVPEVISDAVDWKIQVPSPVRVSVPDNVKTPPEQYTPGPRVWPPNSTGMLVHAELDPAMRSPNAAVFAA
jgi:hypothetical protein